MENLKSQINQQLIKEYGKNYNVHNIMNDMEKLLNTQFSLPLTIEKYEFFKTGGNDGLELSCYLNDNGKIKMKNYRVVVWFGIHKK